MLQQLQARIGTVSEREIPRAQRCPAARALEHYFKGTQRDAAILRAYIEGGHTQTAIAQKTGLSVSRVSRLIAKQETKGKT
jgi:DNA-directed RNA polymerase specialized sigma subunit